MRMLIIRDPKYSLRAPERLSSLAVVSLKLPRLANVRILTCMGVLIQSSLLSVAAECHKIDCLKCLACGVFNRACEFHLGLHTSKDRVRVDHRGSDNTVGEC